MDFTLFVLIFSFTSLILLTQVLNAQDAQVERPAVKLPQGEVQGHYKKSYKGRAFSAFEGIPYAKPPVGDLRFKESEPAEAWENTLIANENYQCPFYLDVIDFIEGKEDCLYMYVYVPKKENIIGDEKYDVVVHIHGGGFLLGSPSFLAGPRYIMDQDVIYVSFNYRLGILGFLSTGDDILPGNNGLKDQVLALKWIKDNIEYFGGNPESITITGMSAGAASVHYHYLSPMSKGLFHRGFSQSGTALQNWGISKKPRKYAQELSDHFGCVLEKLVDCLRNVDTDVLIMSITKLSSYSAGVPISPMGPVIEKDSENAFLPAHPYQLLTSGQVYDVPWITSNVKDEGLFITTLLKYYKSKIANGNLNFMKENPIYLLNALNLIDVIEPGREEEVAEKIIDFYFNNETLTEENLDLLAKLVTERSFLLDADYALRAHSKAVNSPIYYYLFSYILQMPDFMGHHLNGTAHGDDGKMLFEMFGVPRKLRENDEKMVELFTGFLANYAKTGIPTLNDVDWKSVDPDNQTIDYLHIEGPTNITMQTTEGLWVPLDFWKELPIQEYYNNY